jgi:hypothetical protein
VLEKILDWMDAHPDETVIMKVVDCDHEFGTEPDDYDTDRRINRIWRELEHKKAPERMRRSFNRLRAHDARFHLGCTLGQVRGQLLLWRVFKDLRASAPPPGKTTGVFGLDLYDLRRYDDQARIVVTAPAASDPAHASDRIDVLRCQSRYEGATDGVGKFITYAQKMTLIANMLQEAWGGDDVFTLNELNIGTSAGQSKGSFASYQPVTNATYINPLVEALLDEMLAGPKLSAGVPEFAPHSGVGVLLFDWADPDAARDHDMTVQHNHPIYGKVIRLNFERPWMWHTSEFQPHDDPPYVEWRVL